jgi:hypothetical protein
MTVNCEYIVPSCPQILARTEPTGQALEDETKYAFDGSSLAEQCMNLVRKFEECEAALGEQKPKPVLACPSNGTDAPGGSAVKQENLLRDSVLDDVIVEDYEDGGADVESACDDGVKKEDAGDDGGVKRSLRSGLGSGSTAVGQTENYEHHANEANSKRTSAKTWNGRVRCDCA